MEYIFIESHHRKYWIELDERSLVTRQVINDKESGIHISSMDDSLGKGIIEVDEIHGNRRTISEKDFEKIWKLALEPHLKDWRKIKQKYPVGMQIEGACRCFYPQGVIIGGQDYRAVYNGKKQIVPKESLIAQIIGYDEENLWLVLDDIGCIKSERKSK